MVLFLLATIEFGFTFLARTVLIPLRFGTVIVGVYSFLLAGYLYGRSTTPYELPSNQYDQKVKRMVFVGIIAAGLTLLYAFDTYRIWAGYTEFSSLALVVLLPVVLSGCYAAYLKGQIDQSLKHLKADLEKKKERLEQLN